MESEIPSTQKATKPLRLFNYPGSKFRALPWILPLIAQSDKRIYVEPFFGSGNVWLNLPGDSFNHYYVGDRMPYIINFFHFLGRNVGDSDHDQLIIQLMHLYDRWPVCPKPELKRKLVKNVALNEAEAKEVARLKGNYYEFRAYWNTLKQDKPVYSPEVIAGFAYLCGACINNLVRFGKTGDFNQGWGQRALDFDQVQCMRDHVVLKQARTHYNVVDFNSLFTGLSENGALGQSLCYLDPPYGTRTEAEVNRQCQVL
jgi:site-specific DNA-adenine methylase